MSYFTLRIHQEPEHLPEEVRKTEQTSCQRPEKTSGWQNKLLILTFVLLPAAAEGESQGDMVTSHDPATSTPTPPAHDDLYREESDASSLSSSGQHPRMTF